MCIVPFPVNSIESTKLFVLPSSDRKRQMTFYKNDVDSIAENLMILPFPGPDGIQLHKIKYKALFDDLSKSVYKPPTRSWSYDMNITRSCATASLEYIPVISHGSYLVSIAGSLEDLTRINPTVFHLPPDLLPFFAQHYNSEFGYLVCKLKEGKHEYEPLCYSHPLLSTGKLFVPTLHYHDHGDGAKTEVADWDHKIYSMGTTKMANREYASYKENKVVWNRFPEEFQLGTDVPVRCAEVEGNYPNKDIVFELDSTWNRNTAITTS
jgi:hypothetical protein